MIIKERIFNAETGETVDIEREETIEETAKREAFQLQLEQRKAEAEAKAQARAQLLAQLGITEEQAKLLLS